MKQDMDNTEAHGIKPPETVKELGIHFSYMREDISALKEILRQNNFVKTDELARLKLEAAAEHSELRKDLDTLQAWRDGLVGKIAAGAVIMLVLMVLALYGLDKFLTV